MVAVTLYDGLDEIGEIAFAWSMSLHESILSPTIKAIKKKSFYECSRLTTVTIHDSWRRL